MMISFRSFASAIALVAAAAPVIPAQAAGDLLVAPTRVVLDGARGTEVILNNIGAEPATYRISLELRRMLPDGTLEEIPLDQANDKEKSTLSMVTWAPRKVVLAPNQPQQIRIGVRPPEGLPDGEYRAHMLFRAIPDAKPVVPDATPREGVSISLKPIYGVTIPVIVRQGSLQATAAISDAKVVQTEEGPAFSLNFSRTGTRSVYGTIRVIKQGVDKPVLEARGIAVYAEVNQRKLELPIPPEVAAQLSGPVTVQYLEDNDAGGGTIAELRTVIR